MFTEFFLHLSALTGLDPIPLQNTACGIAGSVLSPVLLWTAKRAGAALFCRRPVELSELAAGIMRQLNEEDAEFNEETAEDGGDWLSAGTVAVYPDGTGIYIGEDHYDDNAECNEVSEHLTRRERKAIYARARTIAEQLAREASKDRLRAAKAALEPGIFGTPYTLTGYWDNANTKPAKSAESPAETAREQTRPPQPRRVMKHGD